MQILYTWIKFVSSVYCLIQADAEVKEVQKQLKRNMDEMENYKLLKYVFIHCKITAKV